MASCYVKNTALKMKDIAYNSYVRPTVVHGGGVQCMGVEYSAWGWSTVHGSGVQCMGEEHSAS